MKRKIVSLVLAALLFLSVLGVASYAADPYMIAANEEATTGEVKDIQTDGSAKLPEEGSTTAEKATQAEDTTAEENKIVRFFRTILSIFIGEKKVDQIINKIKSVFNFNNLAKNLKDVAKH